MPFTERINKTTGKSTPIYNRPIDPTAPNLRMPPESDLTNDFMNLLVDQPEPGAPYTAVDKAKDWVDATRAEMQQEEQLRNHPAVEVLKNFAGNVKTMGDDPLGMAEGLMEIPLMGAGMAAGVIGAAAHTAKHSLRGGEGIKGMTAPPLEGPIIGPEGEQVLSPVDDLDDYYKRVLAPGFREGSEVIEPFRQFMFGDRSKAAELTVGTFMAPFEATRHIFNKVADSDELENYPNLRGFIRLMGDAAGMKVMKASMGTSKASKASQLEKELNILKSGDPELVKRRDQMDAWERQARNIKEAAEAEGGQRLLPAPEPKRFKTPEDGIKAFKDFDHKKETDDATFVREMKEGAKAKTESLASLNEGSNLPITESVPEVPAKPKGRGPKAKTPEDAIIKQLDDKVATLAEEKKTAGEIAADPEVQELNQQLDDAVAVAVEAVHDIAEAAPKPDPNMSLMAVGESAKVAIESDNLEGVEKAINDLGELYRGTDAIAAGGAGDLIEFSRRAEGLLGILHRERDRLQVVDDGIMKARIDLADEVDPYDASGDIPELVRSEDAEAIGIGASKDTQAGLIKRRDELKAEYDELKEMNEDGSLDDMLSQRAQQYALYKEATQFADGSKKPISEIMKEKEPAKSAKPMVTASSRSGSTIYVSFDATGKIPTTDNLRDLAFSLGGGVSVVKFKTNLISGTRGIVKFRLDVTNPETHVSSTDSAMKLYRDMFGQEEPISGRSVFEDAIPLEERFSKVLERGIENELTPQGTTGGFTTIANADGKPFGTEKAATSWMELNGIKGEIVQDPVTEGYYIVGKVGTPEPRLLTESASIGQDMADMIKNERGELSVDLEETLRKIREKGKQALSMYDLRGDSDTSTFRTVWQLIDDYRTHENLTTQFSYDIEADLLRQIPDEARRKLLPYVIEETDALLEHLPPIEQGVTQAAKAMYQELGRILVRVGSLEETWDNYVNHMIIEGPKGEKGTISAISYLHRRALKDDGSPWLIRELETRGFKMETDIAVLLPQYVYYAFRGIRNKVFADMLLNARTTDGHKMLISEDQAEPVRGKLYRLHKGEKYVHINDDTLKKWAKFTGDEVKNRARLDLFKKPTYVHKDTFYLLDNFFAEPGGEWLNAYTKARTFVKRIKMFNPLFHGPNVESNVIMALGLDYPKRFKSMGTPEEVRQLIYDGLRHGVELFGLFDIGKRMGMDIKDFNETRRLTARELIEDPTLAIRSPYRTLRDLSDTLLWDRWVKSAQLIIYSEMRARLVKKGFEFERAGRVAAQLANDLPGALPRNWYTKNQRNMLNILMFARTWTVSNMRTVTGALPMGLSGHRKLPQPLRFDGFTNPELKEMGRIYRRILAKGVIGAILMGAIVQAGMMALFADDDEPIRMPWNNEKGKKLHIYTGLKGLDGRPIYIRNWLFRQVNDYHKMVTDPMGAAHSKMEPMLKWVMESLANSDGYAKIRQPGMTVAEMAKAEAVHAIKSLTPVSGFQDTSNTVKNWIDTVAILSGSYASRGMHTDPVIGTMMKEILEMSQVEAYQSKKVNEQIMKAYQRGDMDDAVQIAADAIAQGRYSAGRFYKVIQRIEAPLMHMLATKNKPLLAKYFSSLTGEELLERTKAMHEGFINVGTTRFRASEVGETGTLQVPDQQPTLYESQPIRREKRGQ